MARPTGRWFRSMNELYVDDKLRQCTELVDKYGSEYSSFRQFCIVVISKFGWQNLDAIQKEFDEKTFYGLQFKRMYETNVKRWKTISKRVFARDSYTCAYCGQIGGVLEVDHVVPFSKGGSDALDNLVTSCRKCNRQKKDKSLSEFREWRKRNE